MAGYLGEENSTIYEGADPSRAESHIPTGTVTNTTQTTKLPELYQKQSFNDFARQTFFGDKELNRRQTRKLNRYLNSEQGQLAAAHHNKRESLKYFDSLDARHKAEMAQWQTKADEWKAQQAKELNDYKASVTAGTNPIAKEGAVEDPWLTTAKKYGFNSLDEVKTWQQQNGLTVDGKFGKQSLAKWNALKNPTGQKPELVSKTGTNTETQSTDEWYNHMKGLGYDEFKLDNGTTAFSYGNNVYFNNGRVKDANNIMSDYDYKTLSKAFDFDGFTKANNLGTVVKDGMTYARYDPSGTGDFYIDRTGKVFWRNAGGGIGTEYTSNTRLGNSNAQTELNNLFNLINKHKLGGTMKTKYFQQGGAAPQQDMQQQVIALVQAAMQGDQKATETVNQIMEAAKAGDQKAMQIAQMIQAVAEQMQGQATAAKWGAKLNYIRSLKYAKGGKTCPTCNQKIEMKACGGKKAKKRYFGGWL